MMAEIKVPDVLGQSMTTKADFKKYSDQLRPGIIHGLTFPFQADLHFKGPFADYDHHAKWLTQALHASKALEENMEVKRLVSFKDISSAVGGGAADKALLEVEYSGKTRTSKTDLPTKFFLKLPCKDKGKRLQAATLDAAGAEIAFAFLFQTPYAQFRKDFPIRTPRMFYCDINLESSNFIMIQECLEFSDGASGHPGRLFPASEKFADWKMTKDVIEEIYPLLIKKMALMATWFEKQDQSKGNMLTLADGSKMNVTEWLKSHTPCSNKLTKVQNMGSVLTGITRWFCFWGGRTLLLFAYDFVKNVSSHLNLQADPESVTAEYLDQWLQDCDQLLYYAPEIMKFLAEEPKGNKCLYSHPNMNADNAYFYRSEQDGKTIDCGGLDFGGYGSHPIVLLLGASMGTSDDWYYIKNSEKLQKLFVKEYNATTPESKLDEASVLEDYALWYCIKALLIGVICLKVRSDGKITYNQLKSITSERDPLLVDNFEARCFTKMTALAPERMVGDEIMQKFRAWSCKNWKSIGGKGVADPFSAYNSSFLYGPMMRSLHSYAMWPMVWLYHRQKLGLTFGAFFVGGVAVSFPYFMSSFWWLLGKVVPR